MSEPIHQYVVFDLDGQTFAISADCVREMVRLDGVHRTPMAPPYVRGMMLLRGQTVNLVDLRLLLGMRSHQDVHHESLEEFKKRKQDHINWLMELETSVRENRSFGLTLDPHKCAFGRWYDQFRTDDAVLSFKLLQFDQPHQRVHALGGQIRTLVEHEQRTDAISLIESARKNELSLLVRLFDETIPVLAAAEREIVILVSDGARRMGLIVDDAKEMHEFKPDEIGELPTDSPLRSAGDWVKGTGLNGDRVTVLLECTQMLDCLVS